MSNFAEKIGEKLHIGGHKKEGEHAPPPQATPADPHHAGTDVYGTDAQGVQPQHQSPLDKIKNKVKGGKPKGQGGDESSSSSSSSESDGEGGRRKKKHGVF